MCEHVNVYRYIYIYESVSMYVYMYVCMLSLSLSRSLSVRRSLARSLSLFLSIHIYTNTQYIIIYIPIYVLYENLHAHVMSAMNTAHSCLFIRIVHMYIICTCSHCLLPCALRGWYQPDRLPTCRIRSFSVTSRCFVTCCFVCSPGRGAIGE